MGGRVGLKGTDGTGAAERARALGAVPLSAERARLALDVIARALGDAVEIVAAPGEMGEQVAVDCGLAPRVVGTLPTGPTSAADTERIAREMAAGGVDLLLFAGGDGTARTICEAVGTGVATLGIPTGVKMHSAVYATTPRAAGALAVRALADGGLPCREAEVMDIDEEAFRCGRVSATLYGHLRVPFERSLLQGLKAGGGGGDASDLAGIAAEIGERMGDGALWIVGPGTTTRAVAAALGLPKTLLGVDLYCRGEPIVADAAEATIRAHLDDTPARIVVTPIGGQGFLFGRGNQQLSAEVIRAVGRSNIVVVATMAKLVALRGDPLLVDTGDPALDSELSGYLRVLTGYRKDVVCRVA